MSQSNTQVGDIRVKAGMELTGKEGYLAKMNDAWGPVVELVKFTGDRPLYVITEGAAVMKLASVRPLDPGRNVRLKLSGTCNPGQVLVAILDDAMSYGLVKALPAEAGTYLGVAVAEEAGIEGQLVLARPSLIGNIVISGT